MLDYGIFPGLYQGMCWGLAHKTEEKGTLFLPVLLGFLCGQGLFIWVLGREYSLNFMFIGNGQ